MPRIGESYVSPIGRSVEKLLSIKERIDAVVVDVLASEAINRETVVGELEMAAYRIKNGIKGKSPVVPVKDDADTGKQNAAGDANREAVLRYFREHNNVPITLKELSEKLNVVKDTLHSIFTRSNRGQFIQDGVRNTKFGSASLWKATELGLAGKKDMKQLTPPKSQPAVAAK